MGGARQGCGDVGWGEMVVLGRGKEAEVPLRNLARTLLVLEEQGGLWVFTKTSP